MERPMDEARPHSPTTATDSAPPAAADPLLASVSLAGRAMFMFAVAYYLAKLGSQLAHPLFQSDECFHAHVARWIAQHGSLPRTLPGLYSGFHYYYPPLFHIIGALAVKLAGVSALNYLNLALLTLLFALMYGGARSFIGRGSERWAVLLCLANGTLAVHAVRLYVELLIAVLTFAALLLLLQFRRGQRLRAAFGLGAVVGLALLCKQSAVILPLGLLLLAIVYRVRGERRLAGGLLAAVAIAIAVASPFFVRNAVLFGSPLYPLWGPDVDRALHLVTFEQLGLPAGVFYARTAAEVGIVLLVAFAAALYANLRRGRWDLSTGLMLFCLALPLAAPLLPIHDPRHVVPLIPAIAFLSVAVLFDLLRTRRWAILAVEGVLLVAGLTAVVGMPDIRRAVDEPPELMAAFDAVRTYVPEGGTVLSVWTYDTFYYSGRSATWPIAWGQAVHPVRLMVEQEPDRFLEAMKEYRVGYLLMPQSATGVGEKYPASLRKCVGVLVEQGRLEVLWRTDALVLLGIPA